MAVNTGRVKMINDLLQIVVSTSEQGLWWDSDPVHHDPVSVEKKDALGGKAGFGLVFKLRSGHVCYPSNQKVIKTRQYLKDWKWAPLPFLSIAFGKYGLYLGFKDFRADPTHAYLGVSDGERLLTPGIRFTAHRPK